MIQECLEVAVRVEVTRLTVFIRMNAFCLIRHGEQNDVIIETMVGGAGSRTDLVPMCYHVFELLLFEFVDAAFCGTYEGVVVDEVVACLVPMCGPAVEWPHRRRHFEFSLSEKLKLT